MTAKRIIVILTVLLIPSLQATAGERFQAGGFFMMGTPQNDFRDFVQRGAYGGNFYFAHRLGRSPVLLGAGFGFMFYGWNEREVPFSQTVPDVFVDVVTMNYVLRGHVFLRMQPSRGRLRPYLDALLGLNHLRTDTRVEDDGWDNQEAIASTNWIQDTAVSYGMGGGLMIPLRYHSNRRGKGSTGIYLDIGMRFLKGGRAEYMVENREIETGGAPLYDVVASKTDLLTAHIGISFMF